MDQRDGYRPTRHHKSGQSVSQFLEADIRTECGRRALPMPESVELLRTSAGLHGGLTGHLTLTVEVPMDSSVNRH